jgi:3-mercaptopyruvate sulfurtransferase SseA
VALLLRRQGVSRIRPLAGGFQAWRDLGYPVQPLTTKAVRP